MFGLIQKFIAPYNTELLSPFNLQHIWNAKGYMPEEVSMIPRQQLHTHIFIVPIMKKEEMSYCDSSYIIYIYIFGWNL